VTDVDGTLTTGDEELLVDLFADLFGPLWTGDHVPEAWPGAALLTRALVARGQVLVYLTGRPYWLTGKTRGWLADGGFAEGPLHVADSNEEALPTAGGVGAFKQAFLAGLAARGYLLDEAYGNATTDVQAYAGAGLPTSATFVIGPNGGSGGTVAVSGGWEARAAAVAALPPVAQPFAGE
jgi:phosphatidate phosphatase PAH1